MTALVTKDPAAKLAYTFDWASDVVAPVTLTSVTHTSPAGIVIDNQSTDTANKKSTVLLSGGTHGIDYIVEALATLSNNEQVDASITVRVFQQ